MIKAVIFDFFGVLVTEGVTSFNRDFFHGNREKLRRVDALVDRLNMAQLPYDDFIAELAKLADCGQEEVRQYIDVNHPNEQLIDYIKNELKPSYKIGIISNAGSDYIEEMLGKPAAGLFDDVVLSHSVGFAKPQAAIYQISLDNLDVRAAEAVFIDDISRYVEAARSLGLKGIHYKNFELLKTELEAVLSGRSE